ncbi:hypothetical protein M9979_02290 [Sphingomonas sp. RP10(2022)]|uniref:Uncharacterized protein n=1 Tax=Sphingomonas liriopis TaxID=2949094 RepID=A0A9X2HM62_9SPHN|nr:hypothetical protein [Sphingomonas liriopis]MCP3733711.1 hypothetical protein [Sphingomonas liriopis]
MRAPLAVVVLLAGCGSPQRQPAADTPGARLEAAAVQVGLVGDPAKASVVGSWARDTDRLCVVPGEGDRLRIGALIDYGEGQGCAAAGTAQRRGASVAVDFGACRFDAAFDGERIVFPAELPAACDRLCTGRASLAALTVEHLSPSTSEAETLRTPAGKLLCGTAR